MIPELQIAAYKAAPLVKALGSPILPLGNHCHFMRALAAEPINRGQNQALTNASPSSLRTDTD